MQTHRKVSMSCCCSGVGGTKKWGRDNKGQTFGTLDIKFDLKGSLGLTQNSAKRHLQNVSLTFVRENKYLFLTWQWKPLLQVSFFRRILKEGIYLPVSTHSMHSR